MLKVDEIMWMFGILTW